MTTGARLFSLSEGGSGVERMWWRTLFIVRRDDLKVAEGLAEVVEVAEAAEVAEGV